ncbi:MAG: hypothetical protein EOO88_51085 [Pedobacter sp.]|nr:MAG: hypothetical protein EOO88_51085 [Pedobacter sp.]
MKKLKRIAGIFWMIAGPLVICFLVLGAVHNIDASGTKDINKPVPWIIIIAIFSPVAAGLSIFGYYALRGEYDKIPASSAEL